MQCVSTAFEYSFVAIPERMSQRLDDLSAKVAANGNSAISRLLDLVYCAGFCT
jgi:hypothetical protein